MLATPSFPFRLVAIDGLLFGVAAGVVGTAFTLVSILVPLDRWVWLRLFDLNGVTIFALGAVAAFRVARRQRHLGPGVMASIVSSVAGCLVYTVAQWVLPYLLFDQLVRYPFLHEDYTYARMPSIHDYLSSQKGHDSVVGTTVGMLHIIVPVAVLIAIVFGFAGAWLGRRRAARESDARAVAE
jgi:hypothetical protein